MIAAGGADRDAMGRNLASLKGAAVFGLPGAYYSYNNGAFEACVSSQAICL